MRRRLFAGPPIPEPNITPVRSRSLICDSSGFQSASVNASSDRCNGINNKVVHSFGVSDTHDLFRIKDPFHIRMSTCTPSTLGITAAILQAKSLTSKCLYREAPDFPFKYIFPRSLKPHPTGVTKPIPVTTTRRLVLAVIGY